MNLGSIIRLAWLVLIIISFQNCGSPGESTSGAGNATDSTVGTGPTTMPGDNSSGQNFPPLAAAGLDQRINHNGTFGLERVTLDGTLSADADGAIVDFTWYEGGAVLAKGPSPSVVLEIGVHRLILTVTDDQGASSSDLVTITITGTIPPLPTRPIEVFETTLYPVVRNDCASCHSDQVLPRFASGSVQLAWEAVINKRLADFDNPANSRLAIKARGGHQGFGNTEANNLQQAVQSWVNQSN